MWCEWDKREKSVSQAWCADLAYLVCSSSFCELVITQPKLYLKVPLARVWLENLIYFRVIFFVSHSYASHNF